MSLVERISKIQNYFRGIEYQGGLLIVKVMYPDKIEAQGSKDGLIKVAKSDTDGLWYYYAKADLISEDTLFDLIEETVRVYDEAKEKVMLLRQKVDELREIFASKDLETLKGLQFTFAPILMKEEKPKRKYTRHKQETEIKPIETIEGEIITDENNS